MDASAVAIGKRCPRLARKPGQHSNHKYDGMGRCIRKVVTNKGGLNGTTPFIWGLESDWQWLEEGDSDDALVVSERGFILMGRVTRARIIQAARGPAKSPS